MAILPTRIHEAISGDALSYTNAAGNILRSFFYSQDGVTPFVEREPGQSVFLYVIYLFFGNQNYIAAYFMQSFMFFCSALVFFHAIRRTVHERARLLMLGLLFLYPSIFHINYALTRESLALSSLLLLFSAFLALVDRPTLKLAATLGGLLGFIILTYAPFILLPLPLIALLFWYKCPTKTILRACTTCALVLLPWGMRNFLLRGRPCLTGCTRSAVTWYVRGEQAKTIHGIEPLRCLYAEYVSRDWRGRSPNCSFNGIMNRKWPKGFTGLDADLAIGNEGKRAILSHFGSYLWFSLFEILELHLPYVNGWGTIYNALASISTVFVYIGSLLGLPYFFRRIYTPLMALIAIVLGYTIGVFILTDATPRYLMPVIFCYLLCAGVGYDAFLTQVSTWRKSAS